MYTMNYKLMAFIMTASLLGSGCSEEGVLQEPAAAGTVTTGIADANSFTIARSLSVVDGWGIAGVESTITVRAADRHNHPVPDDTVINFKTNGGRVEPACATVDGNCSVIWNSQNPRPDGTTANPGEVGIAVILAYTTGEESFNDLNGNDAFDVGETMYDISEPFIDHSFDGIRDSNEEFVDFDNDNTFDEADGLYTGASCVGDNTVCNRSGLYVWGSTTVIMSSYAYNFAFLPSSLSLPVNTSTTIGVIITDFNGNPMPAGTTVDFLATSGGVSSGSITVPSSGQSYFSVTYAAPSTAGSASLSVKVTMPESGLEIPSPSIGITIN